MPLPILTVFNILLTFFIVLNVFSFFYVKSDKRKAVDQARRTPEINLFLAAIFFGAMGIFMGMIFWHHKTNKWSFMLGIPLIMLQNIATILYLINMFAGMQTEG